MKIETISFQGWANCLRLSTPGVELIATTDVGPRLLHFARPGGENQLRIFPETAGQAGGDEFRLYGGHRFWIAPEAMPRTYYPDNFPVTVEDQCGFVRLVAPPETTGIQKELDIVLDETQAAAVIVHRARNTGLWPLELAPWAITLMELGGVAILPLPPKGSHASGDLLPAASLAVWSYTDLSDPRFTFTPAPSCCAMPVARQNRRRSAWPTAAAGRPTTGPVSCLSSISAPPPALPTPTWAATPRSSPASICSSWRPWPP